MYFIVQFHDSNAKHPALSKKYKRNNEIRIAYFNFKLFFIFYFLLSSYLLSV